MRTREQVLAIVREASDALGWAIELGPCEDAIMAAEDVEAILAALLAEEDA